MMGKMREEAPEFRLAPAVDVEVILALCCRGHLVLWNAH
ncbi:hypothetical protein [Escherichia phage A221]|nr:hypothetical protein [Escherichia phage A221]